MKILLVAFLTGLLASGQIQAKTANPFSGWKIPANLTRAQRNFLKLDPDVDATTCEIINNRGYDCEKHPVTTKGYIIEVHRIPKLGSKLKPVLLQTGLIGTSADFVFGSNDIPPALPEVGKNIAIELSRQGYDVWLSNNRGNKYGLQHVSLSKDDFRFWNFTFDEMSEFDVPKIIDYVLTQTGSDKLHFIGHSQGSAVMFALLSQTNAYNNKIATFTAISPITRIGFATTSFRALTAAFTPIYAVYKGPVFTENFVTDDVVPFACDKFPANRFCELVFFSVCGFDDAQLDLARMPVYMSHMPSSTSGKNLVHFNQLFLSNKFQKYDYGPIGNLLKYGQLTAPEYKLTNISHPNVYVIYGKNDWFVPQQGVEALKADLKVAKEFYQISNPNSNHMDPLIGIKDSVEVNKKIISILQANP